MLSIYPEGIKSPCDTGTRGFWIKWVECCNARKIPSSANNKEFSAWEKYTKKVISMESQENHWGQTNKVSQRWKLLKLLSSLHLWDYLDNFTLRVFPKRVLRSVNIKEGFPGGSAVKNPPAKAGDTNSIPELGRSPREGNGNQLQYSCLRNPMDRGAWRATVHGVTKSCTWLTD